VLVNPCIEHEMAQFLVPTYQVAGYLIFCGKGSRQDVLFFFLLWKKWRHAKIWTANPYTVI